MMTYQQLMQAYRSVADRMPVTPEIGIVLGSGLGALADEVADSVSIDYSELPGFPKSTVHGHSGRFVVGTLEGVPVMVMQGRVHYYEGYTTEETVRPIRLMHCAGVRTLLLTNAAGGIGEKQDTGSFMLLTDHIASMMPSPLRGTNDPEMGLRFPDMTAVYDQELRALAHKCADREQVSLYDGVYIQFPGPQFETPTEIRFAKAVGADAVGMSTATEAIAARHLGMRVMGISCISNRAAGISKNPLSHEEVNEITRIAAPKFRALVRSIVRHMALNGKNAKQASRPL